jgi:putative tryptophan/tyrosine transport system substrate-binding protein
MLLRKMNPIPPAANPCCNRGAVDVVSGLGPAMRRRSFIQGIAAFAAWPLAARAQQAARSYSIAYLALSGDQDASLVKQRLGELGYSEGKNLSFSFRSAEGLPERLPQLAADLVRAKPDVIVTGFGTETARAAQAATTAIPIVFTSVGDPIGAGIVKSLSQPGANITGLTSQTIEISSKRLQLLEELAPGVRVVAVILSPGFPFTAVALPELRTAADVRGYRLEICEVQAADQLPSSVEAAVKAGATGLTILETPTLHALRRQIVDLAAKLRLPAIYTNRDFADAGGLMSYGTDRRQQYRRAAELVDKVLRGTSPADIPVEQPTRFELVINLMAAKALDLTVPDKLLAIADEVIE